MAGSAGAHAVLLSADSQGPYVVRPNFSQVAGSSSPCSCMCSSSLGYRHRLAQVAIVLLAGKPTDVEGYLLCERGVSEQGAVSPLRRNLGDVLPKLPHHHGVLFSFSAYNPGSALVRMRSKPSWQQRPWYQFTHLGWLERLRLIDTSVFT